MTRLLSSTLSCLLFLAFAVPAFAQNGGDRGGGGEIAAEVFNIARGIAKKLRRWKSDGTLNITSAQIKQIEKIVDLDSTDRTRLLEIYSFPHVYKYPEFAPGTKAGEVTMINIYPTRPEDKPRIDVGEIRWALLQGKALEKEVLTLHELFGAAGILKKGQRIDAAFVHSYKVKLKTLAQWENYKEQLKFGYFQMYTHAKKLMKPDLSSYKSSMVMLQNMPQYKQLQDPGKYVQGTPDEIKQYQRAKFFELVITWLKSVEDLKLNAQEGTNETKAEYDAAKTAIGSLPASVKWKKWSSGLTDDFDSRLTATWTSIYSLIDRDTTYEALEKKCGDADLGKTMTCITEFMIIDTPKMLESKVKDARDRALKNYNRVLDRLTQTVSPDDIR